MCFVVCVEAVYTASSSQFASEIASILDASNLEKTYSAVVSKEHWGHQQKTEKQKKTLLSLVYD